jgi:predicted nucleic acid-binding protein
VENAEAGQVLRFLLDTNVLSELRKAKPHGAVLAWYKSHLPGAYAIPSLALYEIQAGAEITRMQDAEKAREIERWAEALANAAVVLPLDGASARESARLMAHQSRLLIEDAMIAAIARVNGLTVATRNTRDFNRFSVPLVNPFLDPKT